MTPIPKQIRTRLEAMSLTDLDVMAKICGKAASSKPNMVMRVEWVSAVMTEKIINTFNI